jgi:hypothetical protein
MVLFYNFVKNLVLRSLVWFFAAPSCLFCVLSYMYVHDLSVHCLLLSINFQLLAHPSGRAV